MRQLVWELALEMVDAAAEVLLMVYFLRRTFLPIEDLPWDD